MVGVEYYNKCLFIKNKWFIYQKLSKTLLRLFKSDFTCYEIIFEFSFMCVVILFVNMFLFSFYVLTFDVIVNSTNSVYYLGLLPLLNK